MVKCPEKSLNQDVERHPFYSFRGVNNDKTVLYENVKEEHLPDKNAADKAERMSGSLENIYSKIR